MSKLDAQAIAVLVAKSGWFPNDANATKNINTAVGIALAESGGDTNAISSTGDYGLFQINKAAHPDLFVGHDWKNPSDNVAMAKAVYRNAGNSFTPWVTYNNGAYKSHSNGAVIPKSDAPNNARADALDAVKGTGNFIGGALQDVFKFITQGFITIGAFLAALALLLLGAWWLIKDTETGERVKSGAKDAAAAAALAGV